MIHVDENDPVGELELSFPHRDVVIRRGVDAKEFYELQDEIGRGKFGTVYRCVDKENGLALAAKFIPVSRKEDRRNVEREVDIMRSLQHPRLIQLYDAFECGKVMCVILEFIEGGELFERVIDDDFILTEKSCTVFMRQICEGIEFIHKQNILHLDMKPENILCLTKTGNRIKIIDFGLARRFDPAKKLQVLFGTPEFVAPEVVNFDQIGYPTDMWSVGVICYVLLSGLSPFMGETDVQTMANVTIAKYDFDDEAFEKISEEAKDFIRKLLLKDQKERMTAKECLEHAWLRRKSPVVPVLPPQPTTPGLDMTKDNLRLFVERWAEHPNSPYLFDVSCHIISPLLMTDVQLASSHHSLRGMSPSPCGSLSSESTESIPEYDLSSTPSEDNVFHHYTFDTEPHKVSQEYQNFERRASDSSCLGRKTDIAERVNLAEEIRKLSDKLFKMSTMPDFVVSTTTDSKSTNKFRTSTAVNNIPRNTTTSAFGTQRNESRHPNVPWRKKFKVSESSRDVPLSSFKSPIITEDKNTWTNGNGANNALNTKDLLLKLLDKWDDTQEELRTATGRHKSISTEWSEIESLGQKTISSLNTFFQSRTNSKTTSTYVTTNGVK